MTRKKFFDVLPPKKLAEKKIKKQKTPSSRVFRKGLVFAFLFLILFGIISYFTLAKVEIEIWPETEILNFEEKIIANTKIFQVDSLEGIIPARIFEITEALSQEFRSSGEIEKKAEGTIRVYNNYHLLVTLRSGTRFQPPFEEVLYFCSSKKIVIPAKSYIDIKVEACRPGEGEKYNIGPSKFSVPGLSGTDLFFYIHGESFEPMGGGGKIQRVTEDDLETAKNILTEMLFARLNESLKNEILTDFILLEEAIKEEILETSPGVEPGAEVQFFNLQVKAKSKALVFKKSDLESFAKEFILAQIPQNKKFQTESLKVDFQPESIDLKSGKIILNLKFSAKIYLDIDLSLLRENLKGKSLEETKVLLENQAGIIKAQISAWPFWVKKVPQNIEKIKLRIRVD